MSARWYAWFVVCALSCSTGCTTITAVGGGVRPDEIYLVTRSGFYIFQTQRVLRCARVDGAPLACEQVMRVRQAREFALVPSDSAYLDCADRALHDWDNSDRPRLDDAVDRFLRSGWSETLVDDCRAGYATTWNGRVEEWSESDPSSNYPRVDVGPPTAPTSEPEARPPEEREEAPSPAPQDPPSELVPG